MIPTQGEYSTQLTLTHETLIKDPTMKFIGLLRIHIALVDISFSPSKPQENISILTKYYSMRKATKGQAFFSNILKARKHRKMSVLHNKQGWYFIFTPKYFHPESIKK